MISILEKEKDVAKIPLNYNYRNTDEITDFLQKLIDKFFPKFNFSYSGTTRTFGKKPELIEVKNWNDQVTQILKTVERLVHKEKIIPKNIGIIYDLTIKTPAPIEKHLNFTKVLGSKFKLIDSEEYSLPYTDYRKKNCITKDSINRFKGLEKTVIILTNLKEINKETVKKLYTGLSRARTHLIVISNKEVINQIKELL